MAGGAIKGGQVVGASDEIGDVPEGPAGSAAEIAATIYQALGIDLDTPSDRPAEPPVPVVDHGVEPISELF